MSKMRTNRRCRRWVGVAALSAALGTAGAASAQSPTVKVSGFQVTGNTLIERARVDAVLMSMLGQRTLEELHRAAAAVQALYEAEGYGAVVAYLPPQSGQDGLITIAVVEGKVSAIDVQGASTFGQDNIKASLPSLQLGRTPRLRDIDAELRIANENPSKQVQVLMKPGKRSGDAEVELQVKELPLNRFSASLDNSGNERTGDYRATVGWQHGNLTGHDDVAGAQLQVSPTEPQQVRVISAGYRWPLYERHMVIDAFAAYSDIDGGSSATLAGDLRFVGRGRVFGTRVGWYLPRWGEFDRRLTFGLDRRAYVNRCDIDGLPFGACGPAGESVTVNPLSIEYSLQSAGAAPASLSVALLHNLRLGGTHTSAASFEAARAGAKPGYSALRLGLSAAWAIDEQWLLRGRLSGQWTPDPLVSGEQFGLGGAQSLRGYEERELVGDMGLAGAIELTGPAWLEPGGGLGALRPLAFVDAGVVRNQGDMPCVEARSQCSIASAGVGLRYALGSLQARVDLAYALKAAARTQRGDTRAHVALQIGF
ncbi:MAG: ShlB/FhaC/HecB family hemolysin secretion/activation protein [Rubrivivax sp.]